jgi:hypothetical protein
VAVSPATPEYLKWSEVPITFDCNNHPDFVPKPGRYLSSLAPSSRMQNSTESLLMEVAP